MGYRNEETARAAKADALVAELREVERQRDAVAVREAQQHAEIEALNRTIADLGYGRRSHVAAAKGLLVALPALAAGVGVHVLCAGTPYALAVVGAALLALPLDARWKKRRRARLDRLETEVARRTAEHRARVKGK